jgi:acetyl esterase
MPLHPEAKHIIDLAAAVSGLQDPDPPVEELRAQWGAFLTIIGGAAPEPIHHVENRTIPGTGGDIAIRVYRPSDEPSLPVIVYLHGGGWVLGGIGDYDGILRPVANGTGAIVVSVEYRLAPEHRFPAAFDDAWAATKWVVAHAAELGGDPRRVAVMGDSAGGNLAAVIALMVRDEGQPDLALQVLLYPVVDEEFTSPSMIENATGYLLETERMRWFFRQYVTSAADGNDWRVSPMRAADLAGVASALVITAEYDPLRDQGNAYAVRLRDAGVAVEHTEYPGVFHGFFGLQQMLEPAEQLFEQVAAALRRAFREG